MLREAAASEYADFLPQAEAAAGDSLYPCSVAEGRQSGSILTDGNAVLFHHYCGFAFVSGRPDADFKDYIAQRLLHPLQGRRFVLITDDPAMCSSLAERSGIASSKRIYYRTEQAPSAPALLEGMTLCRITPELLPLICGRIIPAWSWETPAQFFAHGFGYCVIHKNKAAAAAFTAAAAADAVDIGVETAAEYRRQGLAKIAAAAVMREARQRGLAMCWAHHADNIGSMKTAQALGFSQTKICMLFCAAP